MPSIKARELFELGPLTVDGLNGPVHRDALFDGGHQSPLSLWRFLPRRLDLQKTCQARTSGNKHGMPLRAHRTVPFMQHFEYTHSQHSQHSDVRLIALLPGNPGFVVARRTGRRGHTPLRLS